MDDFNYSKDCKAIRELLKLSQQKFSETIGVSFSTINRIENNQHIPLKETLEKIYSFGYKNKINNIFLNKIKVSLYLDRYKNLYFHGTNEDIKTPLDLKHSRNKIDFGPGFYLGESYESTRNFVSYKENVSVYVFSLNISTLKTIKFDVSLDWALAISYYRGMLDKYKNKKRIKSIISKIEKSDLVIAPIADNAIFDIVNEFSRGDITDVQLALALSASYLGNQIICKTNKALKALKFIDRLYICSNELEDARKVKKEQSNIGFNKATLSKQEHRREGKYIEEILNG